MVTGRNYKFWFCTGSQDLYGDECLRKVAEHSRIIVEELNKSGVLPFELVWKPTLITNELIRKTFNEANADDECAGVITWMHTFSPAKSWILGLKEYRKPLCHLHTQFNQEIPYDTIDMDFMNENQSAHGGREYGHIVTRMGIERKVIVGHWADKKVQERLASWMRTAVGIMESSHIRVCRVADNMRNVAVTEGDKVEAQIKFGWEVDAYPVNEVCDYVKDVSKGDIDVLVEEYYNKYDILFEGRDPEEFKRHVAVQAAIEIGFERFLEEKNYQAAQSSYQAALKKQSAGIATAADVMEASDTMQSAKNRYESYRQQAANARFNLLSALGLDTSADITIGSVPLPDLSVIDAVDFNTDVEQAIGNSVSVQNTRHQSAGTATEISVKSNQESQAEGTVRSQMQSLYDQLKAARLQYEGAEDAYQSASITYASLQKKQQAGMLSQNDYLQGVADYYSALDAKETAVVNLNQAWETYNWTVKGVS